MRTHCGQHKPLYSGQGGVPQGIMRKFQSEERVNTSLGKGEVWRWGEKRQKRKETGVPGKRHVQKPCSRRAPSTSDGSTEGLGAGSTQGPGHAESCTPREGMRCLFLEHGREGISMLHSDSEMIRFAFQRTAWGDMGMDCGEA